MRFKYSLCAFIAMLCAQAFAADARVETDDYVLLVARPVEVWSPNTPTQERSLDGMAQKRVTFALRRGTRTYGPLTGLLNFSKSSDPTVRAVEGSLESKGYKIASGKVNYVEVSEPVSLSPEDWSKLGQVQSSLYRHLVMRQGDPTLQETKLSDRRALGNVLGVLTAVTSMGTMGVNMGSGFAIGGGMSDFVSSNVGRTALTVSAPHLGAPVDLPTAKVVDVRRTQYGADMPGQIVIGYKVDKTPELELQALIQGIENSLGEGITKDEVVAARKADFEARVAIWKECVAAGKCTAESSTPASN